MKVSSCGTSAVSKPIPAVVTFNEMAKVEGVYMQKGNSRDRWVVVSPGTVLFYGYTNQNLRKSENSNTSTGYIRVPDAVVCFEIREG